MYRDQLIQLLSPVTDLVFIFMHAIKSTFYCFFAVGQSMVTSLEMAHEYCQHGVDDVTSISILK